MQPVYAEVAPRGGAWVEADRLREAVKSAGFKPGAIRYTVTGALVAWHGQPALRVEGSDRLILLQPAPEGPDLLAPARRALASAAGPAVEVEGDFTGRAVPNDPASPITLRARRLGIAGSP